MEVGRSRSPQIFHVTLLPEKLLLDGDEYRVLWNTDEEVHGVTLLKGSSAMTFVHLLIDRVHGTLFYTSTVSRGGMSGMNVKVFLANCLPD